MHYNIITWSNASVVYTYIRTTYRYQAGDTDGGVISFTDLECDPPGTLVHDDQAAVHCEDSITTVTTLAKDGRV